MGNEVETKGASLDNSRARCKQVTRAVDQQLASLTLELQQRNFLQKQGQFKALLLELRKLLSHKGNQLHAYLIAQFRSFTSNWQMEGCSSQKRQYQATKFVHFQIWTEESFILHKLHLLLQNFCQSPQVERITVEAWLELVSFVLLAFKQILCAFYRDEFLESLEVADNQLNFFAAEIAENYLLGELKPVLQTEQVSTEQFINKRAYSSKIHYVHQPSFIHFVHKRAKHQVLQSLTLRQKTVLEPLDKSLHPPGGIAQYDKLLPLVERLMRGKTITTKAKMVLELCAGLNKLFYSELSMQEQNLRKKRHASTHQEQSFLTQRKRLHERITIQRNKIEAPEKQSAILGYLIQRWSKSAENFDVSKDLLVPLLILLRDSSFLMKHQPEQFYNLLMAAEDLTATRSSLKDQFATRLF